MNITRRLQNKEHKHNCVSYLYMRTKMGGSAWCCKSYSRWREEERKEKKTEGREQGKEWTVKIKSREQSRAEVRGRMDGVVTSAVVK